MNASTQFLGIRVVLAHSAHGGLAAPVPRSEDDRNTGRTTSYSVPHRQRVRSEAPPTNHAPEKKQPQHMAPDICRVAQLCNQLPALIVLGAPITRHGGATLPTSKETTSRGDVRLSDPQMLANLSRSSSQARKGELAPSPAPPPHPGSRHLSPDAEYP